MKNMLKVEEGKPENGEWMFRMEANTYYNNQISLRYDEYKIISRTLKGVWVVPEYMVTYRYPEEDLKEHRKFILNDGKKRFAYETREKAKNAFLFRKRRHIIILKSQLSKAESAYAAVGGVLPVVPRTYTLDFDY